jgi:5-methylcytosine-specific restriction endonuclease McrA
VNDLRERYELLSNDYQLLLDDVRCRYQLLMTAADTVDAVVREMLFGPAPGRIQDQVSRVTAHREANAETVQAWRQENTRDYQAERRARKLNAFVANVDPLAIFERDKWTCQLCLGPIDKALRFPDLMCASVDHVIALARGGTHEPANVQAAHLKCNISKGGRAR